jgi:hypothetical protein
LQSIWSGARDRIQRTHLIGSSRWSDGVLVRVRFSIWYWARKRELLCTAAIWFAWKIFLKSLTHRVLTTFAAESEGLRSRDIVQKLVEELSKET